MSKIDWASTQEAVNLVERFNDDIKYDLQGNIIKNEMGEQEDTFKGLSDEEEPQPEESRPQEEEQQPEQQPEEEGGEEEGVTAQVSSNPPDRTESEDAFSQWLHSHPIHETDQEWDQMTLGQGKLYTPQFEDGDEAEDAEDESQSDNSGQKGSEPAKQGGEEPEDYSYLNEWGTKK